MKIGLSSAQSLGPVVISWPSIAQSPEMPSMVVPEIAVTVVAFFMKSEFHLPAQPGSVLKGVVFIPKFLASASAI